MANVLGELFGDIADAIRTKSGETGTMKPNEFADRILGITGSSDDVRYVTFLSYDGSVEYGKKAVAVGDDCADPLARGLFDTPERESTVQYDYTFAGWATSANGALDADALKAVEEDRTVYANFAAVVRYYTISFYDSDGTTLLAAKSVAYGSTPSYTPVKDGYDFDSWTPALTAVTGEASYTAVWKMKATFETATWEQIAEICDSGNAATTFAIGDRKPVTLSYEDGTSETIYFTIVDMDADTKQDGTTAALTLIADSLIRSSVIPASSLGDTKMDIQVCSNMSALLTTIESALPSDLQAVIKPVKKYYMLEATYRTLFVPSLQNLTGSTDSYYYDHTAKYPQKQYAHFSNGNSINRAMLSDASKDSYWTNTAQRGSTSSTVYYMHYIIDGGSSTHTPNGDHVDSHGVLIGFCI